MDWQNIHTNITTLAAEQGRSLSAVCKDAGLGHSFISNLSKSDDPNPTIGSLAKLAAELGVEPIYLLREIIGNSTPPKKNRRREIAALQPTGTDLPRVFRLWSEEQGVLTGRLKREMEKLDLWSRSQIYNFEDGLYIYGWVGEFFLQTLGVWALEAPGNIVGQKDPDQRYVDFTMWIWDRVMRSDIPRRYECDVSSCYDPGVPHHKYEAFYAPLKVGDKKCLLVTAQLVS